MFSENHLNICESSGTFFFLFFSNQGVEDVIIERVAEESTIFVATVEAIIY